MGLTKSIINSFVSGHISPELYGRFDIAQYQNAVKQIKYFEILNSGAIRKRAGTKVVANTTGYNAVVVRNFSFGATEYTFEFGVRKETDTPVSPTIDYVKGYVKIYNTDFVFLKEIETLYDDPSLIKKLNFSQMGDVLFIYSGQYPIQQIIRRSEVDFTIEEYKMFLPLSVSMKDEYVLFFRQDNIIGVLFQKEQPATLEGKSLHINHISQYQQINKRCSANFTSSPMLCAGEWTLITTGERWRGIIEIQKSKDKISWETIIKYDNIDNDNTNYNVANSEAEDLFWVRVFFSYREASVGIVFKIKQFSYICSGTIGEKMNIINNINSTIPGTSSQFLFYFDDTLLAGLGEFLIDPQLGNEIVLSKDLIPRMTSPTYPSGEAIYRFARVARLTTFNNYNIPIITRSDNFFEIYGQNSPGFQMRNPPYMEGTTAAFRPTNIDSWYVYDYYFSTTRDLKWVSSFLFYCNASISDDGDTSYSSIIGQVTLIMDFDKYETLSIQTLADRTAVVWSSSSNKLIEVRNINKLAVGVRIVIILRMEAGEDLRTYVHRLWGARAVGDNYALGTQQYEWEIGGTTKDEYPTDGAFFSGRHVVLHKSNNIHRLSLSKIGQYNVFSPDVTVQDDSPISVTLDYNASESLGLLVDRYIYAFTSNGIFVMGSDNQIVTPSSFKILYHR
jgi:hypothetical protein